MLQEVPEPVVGEAQQVADCLGAGPPLTSGHHVRGFEGWEQDDVEVVDEVPGGFMVEFVYQVLNPDGHSFGGPAHVAPFS